MTISRGAIAASFCEDLAALQKYERTLLFLTTDKYDDDDDDDNAAAAAAADDDDDELRQFRTVTFASGQDRQLPTASSLEMNFCKKKKKSNVREPTE